MHRQQKNAQLRMINMFGVGAEDTQELGDFDFEIKSKKQRFSFVEQIK